VLAHPMDPVVRSKAVVEVQMIHTMAVVDLVAGPMDSALEEAAFDSEETFASEADSMAAAVGLEALAESVAVTVAEDILVHCMVDSMVGFVVAKEAARPEVAGRAEDNHSMAVHNREVGHQPQEGLGSVAAFAAEVHQVHLRDEVTTAAMVKAMAWEVLEVVRLEEVSPVR
jgi:hypothetical protein